MSIWKRLFLGWAIVSVAWIVFWGWDLFYKFHHCTPLDMIVCLFYPHRCEEQRQFVCRTVFSAFCIMGLVPPILLLLLFGGLAAVGVAISRRNRKLK